MSTNASFTDSGGNTGDSSAAKCQIIPPHLAYFPWDNPQNIISYDTAVLIVKVTDGVISPLMAIMGLPLNVVNCLVFFRLGVRERINLLLFCQACVDFLVEVMVVLHSIEYFFMLLAGDFDVHSTWQKFKHDHGIYTVYGFVYVSALISTMIASERCLCIVSPFKAKKFFRSSTTLVFIVVAAVVLVGLHYIISEKFRSGCILYTHVNIIIIGFVPSQFYLQHEQFVDILNGVLYGFGLPFFFVTATIITTTITTVKLRTAAAWRQQMSSVREDQGSEVALTKMLIAVSCLFVVCSLPNIVSRLVTMFVPDFNLGGRYQNMYMGSIALFHVTPAINSALNFFFYVRMGSKFRQTLKQLCCAGRKTSGKKGNVIITQAAH